VNLNDKWRKVEGNHNHGDFSNSLGAVSALGVV
jgi:hypothetical protein